VVVDVVITDSCYDEIEGEYSFKTKKLAEAFIHGANTASDMLGGGVYAQLRSEYIESLNTEDAK
jgi:hypothetical protein